MKILKRALLVMTFSLFALNSGAQVVRFEWLRSVYFGFSTLAGINYYGNWSDTSCPGFLEQHTGKNFMFALDAASFAFNLDGQRKIELETGLRFSFMEFCHKDPSVTLISLNGLPYPTRTPAGTVKSKFHTDYVGIPVDVSFNFTNVSLHAGVSAEILLDSYSKYKYPHTRNPLRGVNIFRSVAQVGISYKNMIGIYVNYAITPMFTAGSGSDARSLSFGLNLGW